MTMKRGTGKRALPAMSVTVVAIVSLALAGCSSGKHKASNATSSSLASSPVASSSGSTPSSSAPVSSGPSGSPGAGGSSASGGSSNPQGASQPANLPQAQIQATAAKNGLSVRLHAGQVIQVVVPAPFQQPGAKTSYVVTPAGSAALTPIAGAPGFYTGAAPGTAKVVVTRTPACSGGSACAAHVVAIGSLTVTVWK